ncbi:MAG: ROK family protein [Ruminococcus flavefaciens]|nr:ROK family protein [Ruminococcus flavefaciens]
MKALVFDIGGTSIKYGICEDGCLSHVMETPTHARLGGRHIMDTIISLIENESGYDAIGISTAGQVNPNTGSIIYANDNIPQYTGIQIRNELQERFHVPVIVENDVNSAAIGEAVYGAGAEFDDFLCLTYGTGIGGAIVQNRSIYRGSSFSAGEFGAIVTHGSQKKKSTDVFGGCYERYASTSALVNKAQELDPSLNNGKTIFEQLNRKDIQMLLEDWTDEIILGLSSLIHIFNPSCIVLGGGIMTQPYLLKRLRQKLTDHIMPSFRHTSLVSASLGNKAGLFGIYYLVTVHFSKNHEHMPGNEQE